MENLKQIVGRAREMDKKKKKIRFRFMPNKMQVVLKGLFYDSDTDLEEEAPKSLVALLRKYGFLGDPCYASEGVFVCYIGPCVADIEHELEYIGSIVHICLLGGPKGRSATFSASLEALPFCDGKDPYDAVAKAFRAWNRAGRPIDNVTVIEALDKALTKINAKRG
jgi:hypothetical protein